MRFRQKPPTEPGHYWALENGSEEIRIVNVTCGSDGLRISCGEGDHESSWPLSDFRLWSAEPIAPHKPPRFIMPKRWINYHKPVKVSLPPSCRRWGHKWVWDGEACAAYNEIVKPKPDEPKDYGDNIDTVFVGLKTDLYRSYGLLFGPDTFEKCARCGEKTCRNERMRMRFEDEMFSTTYLTDEQKEKISTQKITTYADVQSEVLDMINWHDKP